jgi:hypothetical protein
MVTVREALVPELPAIHELAKELLEKSAYNGIVMDDQKFKRTAAFCLGSALGMALVVVDGEGVPQGFLLGMVDELFFSRSRYASDLCMYVRPPFRSAAPKMIRMFVDWAKTIPGVVQISLGISSGIGNAARTGRMYEHIGFNHVGGIYHMRTDQ